MGQYVGKAASVLGENREEGVVFKMANLAQSTVPPSAAISSFTVLPQCH